MFEFEKRTGMVGFELLRWSILPQTTVIEKSIMRVFKVLAYLTACSYFSMMSIRCNLHTRKL